jgi:hypothetical protein
MYCTMDIKCTLNEWKKAQSVAEPRIDVYGHTNMHTLW